MSRRGSHLRQWRIARGRIGSGVLRREYDGRVRVVEYEVGIWREHGSSKIQRLYQDMTSGYLDLARGEGSKDRLRICWLGIVSRSMFRYTV